MLRGSDLDAARRRVKAAERSTSLELALTHLPSTPDFSLSLTYSPPSPKLLNWALNILQTELQHMYENAPDMGGWSLNRKRKEMSALEGRFLVLSSSTGPSAFLFFQFLMEDSLEEEEVVPVLYVLELGVEKAWQGRGLGRRLMQCAEAIARDRGMEKVVLTVFKENTAARKFYKALGYVLDEISADEEVTEASVIILSKTLACAQQN